MNKSAPRILITRLSHIGDCVLTLPLANAIKRLIPGAFVAWAVESPTHHLISTVESIDHIVNVPKSWMKSLSAWRSLRQELKSLRFDTAIDPQGITKSAMLGWLSGARNRIGAHGRWGRELSPYLNNHLIETETTHLVDRSLELLAGLGVEAENEIRNPTFELPLDKTSCETIDQFLALHEIPKFVLINPGASWASKRWELDRFATVARDIWSTLRMSSVITWSGLEELEMAKTIALDAGAGAIVAPPTNLNELASFCDRSSLFIGCDTGPLHIAAAVGTPCVGIHGPTRPSESGAYGNQHASVQIRYQSGSCRKRRSASNDAMREVSVEDVLEAAFKLLRRQSSAAA